MYRCQCASTSDRQSEKLGAAARSETGKVKCHDV